MEQTEKTACIFCKYFSFAKSWCELFNKDVRIGCFYGVDRMESIIEEMRKNRENGNT